MTSDATVTTPPTTPLVTPPLPTRVRALRAPECRIVP
jgi:hypothetical protein